MAMCDACGRGTGRVVVDERGCGRHIEWTIPHRIGPQGECRHVHAVVWEV